MVRDEIRTQASLGSEFKRRYKESENIDRISLAVVRAVNYRYNTVDVSSYSVGSEFSSNHQTKGRYSAKLPIQFSGRTVEGDAFGQVNPIEIGTLVLIGFLDGKKTAPIVISVVGHADDNKELSRSPVDGADPKDTEMKQLTQQSFKVYPSLTYENVDGFGNRVTSFTGKSFVAFDADSGDLMGGLSDDGVGTAYEDFDSSYYYSGKLIEPKESKAPVLLLKHQGHINANNEKGYEENDNVTMMFIDQDGTYRTSVVNSEEEARSYIELDSQTGRIRLRKQNDSTKPGRSDDYTGIDIDDYGILFSHKGKNFRLDERGMNGLGGLGGSGKVPEEVFDRINKKIDRLNRNIIDLGTYFVSSDEFIELGAYLTETVGEELVKYDSRLTIMAEEIESALSETRIKGMIDNGLEEYSKELAKLVDDAKSSLSELMALTEDGIITPSEKLQVATIWEMIKAEYPGYRYQAEQAEVDLTAYQESFNQLENYIQPILDDMSSTSEVEPHTFAEMFERYYLARTELLRLVFDYFQERLEEAVDLAKEAGKDANKALGDSAKAITQSGNAINRLQDMASDEVITSEEKHIIRRDYEQAISNYDNYLEQAKEFGIDTSSYTQAKNKLDSLMEDILSDMTISAQINEQELVSAFSEYVKAQLELTLEFARLNRNILLQVQEDFAHYDTNLKQTSREIELLAESVEAQGREIKLATAQLTVQADKISGRVTKTELQREINENRALNANGENLFIRATATDGVLVDGSGEVEASSEGKVSNFISVVPRQVYMATLFDNNTNNELVVAYYDSARQFISSDSVADNKETFTLQTLSPPNAQYARVSYIHTGTTKAQFEKGYGSNFFMYSPADLVENIEYATIEYENRKRYHQEAEQAYYDLDNQARLMLGRLNALEGSLDQTNLTMLQNENERIQNEIDKIVSQAKAQGLVTIGFESRAEMVNSYIGGLSAGVDINKPVIVDLFDNYYQQRGRLLNSFMRNAEEAYRAAESVLDETLTGVLEADKLARTLAYEAERASQNVAHMLYEIERANQKENEHITKAEEFVEDGTLTPEEKIVVNEMLQDILEEREYIMTQANFYGLGSQDFINALNGLDSYLSPILSSENRAQNTPVTMTMVERFRDYHYAKLNLLDGVLRGSRGEYTSVSEQLNVVNEETRRRDKQLQDYRNAVEDSKLAIIEVNEKIESLENSFPYSVQITSTNGLTFKNSVINTYLKAELFEGGENVTSRVKTEDFVWRKIDGSGNEDKLWNDAHKNVGPQIHLTHEDIDSRATFVVEIFEEEEG